MIHGRFSPRIPRCNIKIYKIYKKHDEWIVHLPSWLIGFEIKSTSWFLVLSREWCGNWAVRRELRASTSPSTTVYPADSPSARLPASRGDFPMLIPCSRSSQQRHRSDKEIVLKLELKGVSGTNKFNNQLNFIYWEFRCIYAYVSYVQPLKSQFTLH